MAGRDDGEFELILGNKQLLSVLFIVIVLLGVFFAMGFLAGRTTGAGPVVAQNNSQERQPLAVDSASSRPPLATEEKTDPAPGRPAEPAASSPAPGREPKAEPVAPVKRADEAAAAKAAPAKSAKPDPNGFIAAPPAGTYLQAAATRRADAEAMLAGIRTKTGLTGYVTPSPKSAELFRVIAGPLTTKAQQAGARVKLAEIGVKNPFLVTY
jgi:cell division septation protein DedD